MTDYGNGPEPQETNAPGTDELAASSQDANSGGGASGAPEETGSSTASGSEGTGESGSESAETAAASQAPDAPASAQPGGDLPTAGEAGVEETSTGAPVDAGTGAPASADEPTAPDAAATEGNEGPSADLAHAAEGAVDVEGGSAEAGAGESEGDAGEGGAGEGGGRRGGGGNRSWRPPRLTKEEMREIWTELQAKKEASESIDLEVVGHNRGGVVTQYRGLEVFIPMSHWSLERHQSAEPTDIKTGSTIQANILEITDFDTDARRVTATRRALLRHNVLGTHAVGERMKGKVSSIHDFGIFVDLGGVDGLVHASEISHVRGRHPSELVKIGDEVDVVVKEIDPTRERIYLGMKELGPSPWDNVEERYPEGSTVQGRVVGFSKNGAFVEVEPGIEGFIRMRELSWTKRVQRPKDVLKKGAEIPVHVLEVSGRRQRLSLSYRQAVEDPWPQIAEKYAVGTSWKGNITELSNKGVVVDIGEVEGFLPRGRMGREAKRLPDMKAGDELEVNVIEVDAERNSLIFGLPGAESGGERGERSEHGGGGGGGERGGFGGGGGGERRGGGGGGDRGPRGGGGGGGDRGERRDRGDRRDRDRGPVTPAKPTDEIKSAANVSSFSLGDLLGDQIKSKLGIKEEPKKERPKQEKREQTQSSSADAEQGGTDMGGAPSPAAFQEPLDVDEASKAGLPLQSQDAVENVDAMSRGEEPRTEESQTPADVPESAQSTGEASESAPEPEPREPDPAAGDQDTAS
jgi:predicted RNA-binding protein with RPS1 domain